MTGPKRIQRRRTRGWRMPKGAVYVGRPTRWGNPYEVAPDAPEVVLHSDGRWWTVRTDARSFVVGEFRADLVTGQLGVTVDDVRRELVDRDLVCWCPLDQPCHADVLLELANLKQIPANHGCTDCEWVEERRLCDPAPTLLLARPCKEHA